MRGHTLIELLYVVLLMGVATASFAPVARERHDRARVVGAREAVVSVIAEARAVAMERGAASVRITADPPTVESRAEGVTLRRIALGAEFGVTLSLSGAAADVDLTYDALGLGRLANQTLTFRRGSATSELVVSGYGRVRRR